MKVPATFSQPAWGQWVKTEMECRAWSQTDLAEHADVSTPAIRNWIKYERPVDPEVGAKVNKAFVKHPRKYVPAQELQLPGKLGSYEMDTMVERFASNRKAMDAVRTGLRELQKSIDKILTLENYQAATALPEVLIEAERVCGQLREKGLVSGSVKSITAELEAEFAAGGEGDPDDQDTGTDPNLPQQPKHGPKGRKR